MVRVLGDRLRLVENEAASNPSPANEATGGAHRARKRSRGRRLDETNAVRNARKPPTRLVFGR